MKEDDYQAAVISFAAALGQGAGCTVSLEASAHLEQEYLQKVKDAEITPELFAETCKFMRTAGAAARVKAESSASEAISREHVEEAVKEVMALGSECPFCPG